MRRSILPIAVLWIALACLIASLGEGSSRLLSNTAMDRVQGGDECNSTVFYLSCRGPDGCPEDPFYCTGDCATCNANAQWAWILSGTAIEIITTDYHEDGCGEVITGVCRVTNDVCWCDSMPTGTPCSSELPDQYNSDCIPPGT